MPASPKLSQNKSEHQIILGIDPGSHFTGFGVLRVEEGRIVHLSHGVIAPPSSMEFCARIGVIAGEIEALLERVTPNVTVVERVFLGKNADSAFKLGHARGVVIASAVRAGSNVVEYATRAVKKGITGNGGASKDQVQAVLFALLGIRGRVQMDASDALALAFYHARNLEVEANLARHRPLRTESDL
jgi:crossover junction endodeoxyribonuclease RuvC